MVNIWENWPLVIVIHDIASINRFFNTGLIVYFVKKMSFDKYVCEYFHCGIQREGRNGEAKTAGWPKNLSPRTFFWQQVSHFYQATAKDNFKELVKKGKLLVIAMIIIAQIHPTKAEM